jgi:hypothetical protein
MGNTNIKWVNKDAIECSLFLKGLLGPPSSYSTKKGGIAVWEGNAIKKKKILGGPSCFEKIIVKDESVADRDGEKNYLYFLVHIPISEEKMCEIMKMIKGCGYDFGKQNLWVRSGSFDEGIVTLKAIVDYLNGNQQMSKTSMNDLIKSVKAASPTTKYITVKSNYPDVCNGIAKIILKGNPNVAVPENSENMMDAPWYATMDPYYASSNPGNIALGEMEESLYYRRQQEKPVIFPSLNDVRDVKNVKNLRDVDITDVIANASDDAFSKKEHLLPNPPSPNCKGACLDRYYTALGNPNTGGVPDIYTKWLNANNKTIKVEYMDSNTPATFALADKVFEPIHRPLFNMNAHLARLEMFDNPKPLTLAQTMRLFEPRDPLTVKKALSMVEQMVARPKASSNRFDNSTRPLTMGQMYQIFLPRKEVSIREARIEGKPLNAWQLFH